MKRIILAAGLAVFASAASAQDPAIGTWQTEVDDGAFALVQMSQCGSAVCGTIVRTYRADGTEYESPNKGLQIVRSMSPVGGGAYEGEVLRPANDKVYIGKMQVTGDRLTLKGCVAGGLICANQAWKKLQ